MIRALLAVTLLVLAACEREDDTLAIGSKDFGENMILAEMMAALAEEAGIPVLRRIGLGPTRVNFEALRRGEIDAYPEYTGTGLVMVGQPALSDGDAALARVRELYDPLDLVWGDRFGFANNYGLAMRAEMAEELGIEAISDLEGEARGFTIGIDENFLSRPLDGFAPMLDRYGLRFGDRVVVPPEERTSLYDALLAGDVELIEVFTTDGQIADFGLKLLEDDLDFFPVYQAAPLYRAEALARFPGLRDAIDPLTGQLDAALMRQLNARVDQAALSPREVARAALAEMGLLEGDDELQIDEPLVIAHSPLIAADDETGRALRAARTAFPNRRVLLEAYDDPLAAVGRGAARIALAAGVEFAELDADGDPDVRPFEALGVVGQSYLHLVARNDDVRSLEDVETLATGPVGSASHRAAEILAAGLGGIALSPGDEAADAALVLAPLGAPAVRDLLEDGGRLIPASGWGQGTTLVRFPYLREARIPAESYKGQREAVETLSSQLVLAGPVVIDTDAVGPQGPGASAPTEVAAIPPNTAAALSDALASATTLDPAIPQAEALAPTLPPAAAPVNPSPAVSALTLGVMVLFAWLIWLYARPERR